MEDGIHRLHHPTPETIELDMVNGRQEPRLAKTVGPGPGILARQRVVGVLESQFLECCRRFCEQDMTESVVWQVRQLQRDRGSTQTSHCVLHCKFKDVSEITFDIADAHTCRRPSSVPAKARFDA